MPQQQATQQQPKPSQQQQQQKQSPQQQQKQLPPPQQQQKQPQQQQSSSPSLLQTPVKPPAPVPEPMKMEIIEPPPPVITTSEEVDVTNDAKPKPAWVKKDGKVNRRERLRRRNQRLRKILQPKNALMVLNELAANAQYELSDASNPAGTLFKCVVVVDGIQHVGMGKSKPIAKNTAAETALKHMVLSKLKTGFGASNIDSDGDVKMEVEEDAEGISWSHVACYALHKLLNSWDEGTNNIAEKVAQGVAAPPTDVTEGVIRIIEKKPAKKLPDNAASMNPIMLLNQMQPDVVYEEMSRNGAPPKIEFTVKCSVGGDVFFGTGTTKKAARKYSAFAACQKILKIKYTPEFLEEHGYNETVNCPPPPQVEEMEK